MGLVFLCANQTLGHQSGQTRQATSDRTSSTSTQHRRITDSWSSMHHCITRPPTLQHQRFAIPIVQHHHQVQATSNPASPLSWHHKKSGFAISNIQLFGLQISFGLWGLYLWELIC